jgi:FtsP/CotA-like multicopper oxidase with cupredoxin domain
MMDMRHSEIGIFAGLLAAKTQVRRRLALTEYPRPGYADQKDFYLTEMKPGAVIRPYDMNGPPAFTVEAGIAEEWDVENWTRELHAFHAHQVHFRVLSVNGKVEATPPLRDIVNVPFATPLDPAKPDGPLKPGIVRIKIVFPKEFAGDIPIHCHLVDHEDNGMMAVVHVAL